jgi:hypothetical protein
MRLLSPALPLSLPAALMPHSLVPDHKLNSNYSFEQLVLAYGAERAPDGGPHDLLYRGGEILALCLRYKYNHHPAEVWVGHDPISADWGRKLADLKDKKTLPLYYSPRGRTLYQYKGQHLITGDTTDPQELTARRSPAPLSRIVFLRPLAQPTFAP